MFPPSGIASRALMARLSSTCTSCVRSARTHLGAPSVLMCTAMSGPSNLVMRTWVSRTTSVQVERLEILCLASAQGQELPGELGHAFGPCLDLAEIVTLVRRQIGALQDEVCESDDHRHLIVRFVCEAAGEPADALDALRPLELGSCLHSLGHIHERPDGSAHSAELLEQRRRAPKNVGPACVVEHQLELRAGNPRCLLGRPSQSEAPLPGSMSRPEMP